MAWRFLWAISPHPRPSSCTPRTSTERDSVFPPSLINFSPKILVFLKIALYFLGMQLGVSPAELSRGSDPKASALRSSRRPSADSAEGLRRVPNEVVPRLRRPKPELGYAVPEASSPRETGTPAPQHPQVTHCSPKPPAPSSSSVLALTLPGAPGSCEAVGRGRLPAAGQARSSGSDAASPNAVGWVLGRGWGGSLPRCCPSRASARASRLPQPPQAPARLPPAAPRPRPQYPDGSRSYLQGPPRLSASPPPSCISERLHFSGSQL